MAKTAAAKSKAILIAEDDEGLLFSLQTLLRREGFTVVGATGGEEAAVQLDDRRFDLVLSDLRMPDRDGIDLLQEVRRRQPDAKVVLMTCYGDMDTYMEAMDEGAFDYVNKPIVKEELLALLRRALGMADPRATDARSAAPEAPPPAPPT